MNKISTMIITVVAIFSMSLPLHTFAQGASVDDFFAQIDAYNAQVVEREVQRESTYRNPLHITNFVPEKEERVPANNRDLVVDEEGGRSLAMAGSASQRSGEYGEVVRYGDNNPQYYQASVIGSRSSSNIINNGTLLVLFMIIIIVMIIIRMRKRRKQITVRRKTAPQDGFHDMERYHPPYRNQPVH